MATPDARRGLGGVATSAVPYLVLTALMYAVLEVSPLLVVARAVCLAARRTPELNATWDEAAQEIVETKLEGEDGAGEHEPADRREPPWIEQVDVAGGGPPPTILRGLVGGASVAIGLPPLDAMFNSNGTAYAQGASIPKRLGVFFWGNGIHPGPLWTPTATGDASTAKSPGRSPKTASPGHSRTLRCSRR